MTPEEWDRRNMTETQLKQHVLDVIAKLGWAVYHVPHQKIRNGGGVGFPDLVLARDKEVLFIELKRDGGKLEPMQAMWSEALPAYHVIRPVDLENGRLRELVG